MRNAQVFTLVSVHRTEITRVAGPTGRSRCVQMVTFVDAIGSLECCAFLLCRDLLRVYRSGGKSQGLQYLKNAADILAGHELPPKQMGRAELYLW